MGLPVLNRVWYSRVATVTKIKSSLYSQYYAKRVTSGGNHLRGLTPGLHSSEGTSQGWRAVGDTVSI